MIRHPFMPTRKEFEEKHPKTITPYETRNWMAWGFTAAIPIAIAINIAFPPSDTNTQATAVKEVQQVQEKTPEQLAAENAEIQKKVNAAIEEAGPQSAETPAPSTFEQQLTERYSVTMTESEAFADMCSTAKMYLEDGATNLQAREEIRAYAEYIAPKTGNPGLRTQLAQHGINCLY